MAKATAIETSNDEVQDIPQVALPPASLLSNCDILTFLAIIQNARVPLLDFEPILPKERERKGHGTFVVRFSDDKGLVFKTASVDQDTTVEDARRRLLSEILILQHPALRNHPNFLLLRGVAWEVYPDISSFGLAMPVLVFEECQIGTLKELMIPTSDCRERAPFLERLSLCNQIGSAVEVMHRFKIIHGDIKHTNVLVMKEQDKFIAKIIDFDCSGFGRDDTYTSGTGYSGLWAAPQVYLPSTISTRENAQKADIFSYGRLCVWLLFFPEVDAESADLISAAEFDFDTAMHSLLSNREAKSGALANQEFVNELKPILRRFFLAAYCNDPEARASFQWLSFQLSSILYTWRLRYELRSPYKRAKFLIWRSSLGSQKVWHSISGLIAKAISRSRSRKTKPEFEFSDDLQITIRVIGLLETIGLVSLVLICLILVLDLSILVLVEVTQHWPNQEKLFMLSLLIIVPGLILYPYVWYHRSRYSLWTVIAPYGHIQHLVPSLPELFPCLNRLHYPIREEVVKCLLEKTIGTCDGCAAAAHLQLSLCCQTGFGKVDEKSLSYKNWLGKNGKRDVTALCREVDFWEDRYSSQLQQLDGYSEFRHLYKHEPSSLETSLPNPYMTVSRYLEEIDRKIESKVCTTSAILLLEDLGLFYLNHAMYQEAELAFRKMQKLGQDEESRYGLISKFTQYKNYLDYREVGAVHQIALALVRQRKFHEAIEAWKSVPGIFENPPNHSGLSLFRTLRKSIEWDMVKAKATLGNLLVQERRLQEAMDLHLVETLYGKVNSGTVRQENAETIEFTLQHLLFLATSLSRNGELGKSIEILERRVDLCIILFGDSKLQIWKSNQELASFLTFGTKEQLLKAQEIQNALLAQPLSEEHHRHVLSLMTDYSLALSKSGNHSDAVLTLQKVLKSKQEIHGDCSGVSVGAMCDLAGGLQLHGKKALETPARIQRELLALCMTHLDSKDVQTQIITVLWHLSKPEHLDDALKSMRELLCCLQSREEIDRVACSKLESFVAFILAYIGVVFEDKSSLEEALQTSIRLEQATPWLGSQQNGANLHASQLVACVYSKMTILHQRYGFGCEDIQFLEESVRWHRCVVERASLAGELVIEANTRLAIELALVGKLLGQKAYISEAEAIFHRLILCDENTSVAQANYHLLALRLAQNDGVEESELILAWKKMRDWMVGEAPCSNLGDTALYQHLVSCLGPWEGFRKTADELTKLRQDFTTLRSAWNKDPSLHPDSFKAVESCTIFGPREDMLYRELAQVRWVNVWAPMLHSKTCQQPIVTGYKMTLVIALSCHDIHHEESIQTAIEILDSSEVWSRRENTQTAMFIYELAMIYSRRGIKDEAVTKFGEALEMYNKVLGIQHLQTLSVWDSLIREQAKDRYHRSEKVIDDLVVEATKNLHTIGNAELKLLTKLGCRAILSANIHTLCETIREDALVEFKQVLLRHRMGLGRINATLQSLKSLQVL